MKITACIVACLLFMLFGLTGYGLYLAFSASIVLGVIVLFVEPMPLIIGILQFFFDYNLAERIVNFFNQ